MNSKQIFKITKGKILITIFILVAYLVVSFSCTMVSGSVHSQFSPIPLCGQFLYFTIGSSLIAAFEISILWLGYIILAYLLACIIIKFYKKIKWKEK